MIANVSQILDFQRCELDWYYKWVLKRVRRGWGPVYFQTGIWWHKLMEHYFRAFNVKDGWHANPHSLAATQAVKELVSMVIEAENAGAHPSALEFRTDCEKLLELFSSSWTLKFPPATIESVELPIKKRLPSTDHFLIGIPDTVITFADRRWHLQHKTASDRTNMPIYLQLAQRNLHELCYAWLLEDGSPYGGTYLNLIRKLSGKAIAENPRSAFVQELIPLDPLQIDSARRDVARIMDRMDAITSGKTEPIDNREADVNSFRNSLSPYFDVKLGIADLADDDVFMPFVSRYEGVEILEPRESTGHLKGCRCPLCDPDFNDPRSFAPDEE